MLGPHGLELAERMEKRAEALRQLAAHPWFTQEGKQALLASSDLYAARARNFRSRAS